MFFKKKKDAAKTSKAKLTEITKSELQNVVGGGAPLKGIPTGGGFLGGGLGPNAVKH